MSVVFLLQDTVAFSGHVQPCNRTAAFGALAAPQGTCAHWTVYWESLTLRTFTQLRRSGTAVDEVLAIQVGNPLVWFS